MIDLRKMKCYHCCKYNDCMCHDEDKEKFLHDQVDYNERKELFELNKYVLYEKIMPFVKNDI